jgi:hypothetical protein
MKGVLPWLVHCAVCILCRYKDFFFALAALVGPVQNIIFLTVHFFNSFVLISQQDGQAVVLGHLSLSMCLLLLACPLYCPAGGEGGWSKIIRQKKRDILPYICSMTRFLRPLHIILGKKKQQISNFFCTNFCFYATVEDITH